MKLKASLFRVLLLGFLLHSNANAQLFAPCSSSYFFDSYGIGLTYGFLGINLAVKGRMVSKECFLWGSEDGGRLKAEYCPKTKCRGTECGQKFMAAYRLGRVAQGGIPAAQCSAEGFRAGIASLDYAAREGNRAFAGDACVQAYRQGSYDGRNRLAGSLPEEQPARHCYELGKWEQF
jgi:hypothetical protein